MIDQLRVLRTLWPLLGIRSGAVVVAAGWGTLALTSSVGLAAVSAWLIARASQMPSVLDLTIAVVTVRALGIGRGTFRYLDRVASHDVALRASANLRSGLYQRLAAGQLGAVATLRRGEILRRWGTDADEVGDLVVRAVLPAVVAFATSCGTVALLAAFSPAVAAVAAGCLAASGLTVPVLAAGALRRSEVAGARAHGAVVTASMTLLDGAGELAASGRDDRILADLAEAEQQVQSARDRAARPAAAAQGVTVVAMGIVVLAALIIGAAELADGTVSAVELAILVLTPLAAFEAVSMLAPAAVQFVKAGDAGQRLLDLLQRAQQPAGRGREPVQPSLHARNLSIGWPGAAALAQGIDLDLTPGRSVMVIGPNGSGKTTLLATLAGLLVPPAGQCRLGGIPTGELALGAAARVVTLTTEDAHIFDTTVLENLRVCRGDVTAAEAKQALRQAGLGEFLRGLPSGLQTPVGSAGARISGGERRRLLIARALLSDAPLLLFDEPDEHLDPATAQAILTDLLALADTGRGVLVVSHRRSAAMAGADRVVDLTAVHRQNRGQHE
ncbi:MAG: thiol reductant ABC exporter subunit CydC [Beutenbergiaceae bacterium]